MHALNLIGITFPVCGVIAWSAAVIGKRFDQSFAFHTDLPAPAEAFPGSDGGAAAARHPIGAIAASDAAAPLDIPARMRFLARDEIGRPIPYLATLVNGASSSIESNTRLAACHAQQRCWICGDKLGRYTAFMTEPIAAITRISRTPPAHAECAKYSAQSGLMQPQDLGVALVWVSRGYSVHLARGAELFAIGDAEQAFWYRSGRLASRDEVTEAIQGRLPQLYAVAHEGGPDAVCGLDQQVARATRQFPPHAALSAGM